MPIFGGARPGPAPDHLLAGSRPAATVVAVLVIVAMLTLAVLAVGIVLNAHSAAARAGTDGKADEDLP
jgi:hypothetical protein